MNEHLPAEQLNHLLEGKLAGGELTSVEQHLDHCESCQQLLVRLTEDPVTKHWHSLHKKSRLQEKALDGVALDCLTKGLEQGKDTGDSPHMPDVPGYTVLNEIGRGGMGVVYRAVHRDLNRQVALKMILAGKHASEAESSRFRREAETLALLMHPNIVQVFDVGVAEGCVYIVMELVEGPSLAKLIRDQPQPARAAAALVETLSLAVQHAHEHGVVHRDLKPANILLSGDAPVAVGNAMPREGYARSSSPASIPKVADFGLAKQPDKAADVSRTGEFMGTPSYMAPEQARGKTISAAVDVHALGGILYELLTGRPPFQGESSIETLFHVVHDDPVPPNRLHLGLPRDLEMICLKCLQKEPRRRYPGAAELAADLRRFLDGQPVWARPTPSWERAWKWARRHPAVAALSVLLVLVTALGFGLLIDRSRAADAKALAEKKAHDSETAARQEAERLLAGSFLDQGIHLCETDNVASGLLWMVRSLKLAESLEDVGLIHATRANIAAWRQWLVHLRHALYHDHANQDWVTSVAFSPDGKLALAGNRNQTACRWDVVTGKAVGQLMVHDYPIWSVAFSPNGNTILTGSGDDDPFYTDHQTWTIAVHSGGKSFREKQKGDGTKGEARLWDARTCVLLGKYVHPGSVAQVQWSKDGIRFIAIGSGQVVLWELNGQKNGNDSIASSKSLPHPGGVLAATFDPAGNIVATGGADGTVRLWDATTGKSVGSPMSHPGPVNLTVFQPGKRVLLTGSIRNDAVTDKPIGGEARLWNVDTCKPVGPPVEHRGPVKCAAFCADGRIAATGGFVVQGQDLNDRIAGEAQIWDTTDGQLIGPVLTHPQVVSAIAMSPNGRLVATGCRDGQVRWWLPRSGKALQRTSAPSSSFNYGNVTELAFSPDGESLVAANLNEKACAQLFDVPSALELPTPLRHQRNVSMAVFTPNGSSILTGSNDGTARLWDALTGKPIGDPLQHSSAVTHLAIHPNGQTFATACIDDGTVYLWDATTLQPTGKLSTHSNGHMILVFSRNGQDLVVDDTRASISIFDPVTARLRRSWEHPAGPTQAAFSPDNSKLLTGSQDNSARLWELSSGTLLKSWKHFPDAGLVAFSPDAKLIALAGHAKDAQMWTLDGEPFGPPLVHRDEVQQIAFSPDGQLLLTGSRDKTARLWDVATGKSIGPPLEHPDEVFCVSFNPQGGMLATACKDGTVHRWEIAPPVTGNSTQIKQWIEALAGMRIDDKGTIREVENAGVDKAR